MGYLANFIVYTLAMVGVIVVALLVFKNATSVSTKSKSKNLRVLESISIAPRKNLFIISAGSEKFLIAGDADRTTLISKLNNTEDIEEKVELKNNFSSEEKMQEFKSSRDTFQETMRSLSKSNYMDKSNIGINSSLLNKTIDNKYNSVIKNLAERIRN